MKRAPFFSRLVYCLFLMAFSLMHTEQNRAEASPKKGEYVSNEKLSDFLDKEGMETGISLSEARKRYGFTDCQEMPPDHELVCINSDAFEYLPKVREIAFVFGFFDTKTGVLNKIQKRIGVLGRGFDPAEFSEKLVKECGLSGSSSERHSLELLKSGKKIPLEALNFAIVHHGRAVEVHFMITFTDTPNKKPYESVLLVLTDKGPHHQKFRNENPQLTEDEKGDLKSVFELAIRTCSSDIESTDPRPGKPLELKDLFTGDSSVYPRWDGPYVPPQYFKYIDLFTVKATKKRGPSGLVYWKYEVIAK